MILVYVVYCVVLHFNPQLEQWGHSLPVPCKPHAPEEQSGLMTYKTLDEEGKHPNYGLTPDGQENVEQGKLYKSNLVSLKNEKYKLALGNFKQSSSTVMVF